MHADVQAIERLTAGVRNAVTDVCGTPCQDIIDGSGIGACAVTWGMGCGEDTPAPLGFGAQSIVAELCAAACAAYVAKMPR